MLGLGHLPFQRGASEINLTIGNVSVIAAAIVAIVTGIVQRDALAIGTGVLTLVGVFVHPPQVETPK